MFGGSIDRDQREGRVHFNQYVVEAHGWIRVLNFECAGS